MNRPALKPQLLVFIALFWLAGPAPATGEGEILAVTTEALRPGLEAWIAHRKKQGHTVRVRIFETGNEKKEALVEEIRQRSPAMVLLAGDVTHLPAFTFKKCETDLPYGLPDAKTAMPAVQVGRVPAADAVTLEAALAKVIRHETTFTPSAERNKILLLCGPGFYGETVDRMIEGIGTRMVSREVDQSFDVQVIFAQPTSPYFLPPADLPGRVRAAFEAGPLIVVYNGHGNDRRFAPIRYRGYHPYFSVANVRGMECARAPIYISLTCSTGDYENPKQPGLCAQMMLEPRGPVASFGSSEVSQPLSNLLLNKSLMQQVINKPQRTIGDAVAAMRRDFSTRTHAMGKMLMKAMGQNVDLAAEKVHHQYLYNLFGDPATRLRFPKKDLRLSVAVDGGKVVLEGESPSVRAGKAVIRLDVERRKLLGRVEPHVKAPAAKTGDIIRRNYAMASLKTLVRHEVPIVNGRFRIEMPAAAVKLPDGASRRHRTFYFRVYAWNARSDAAGSAALDPDRLRP